MFEHFVIKNFRCFSGLHLKQLQRVNLIAGKNNTGKTALLEAIHPSQQLGKLAAAH
jgi:AAA15 family ATPase/GTPase